MPARLSEESTNTSSLKTRNGRMWWMYGLFLCVWMCLGVGLWSSFESWLFAYQGTPRNSGPVGARLAEVMTRLRKEKNLVGLAAMVMVDGQIVASAADGERLRGSGKPVEIGDRWHLGSITKSITATMIARLIEAGQIKWSDTVGECFSEESIHEDWKPVTLEQLLTHTSGAPANFSLQVRWKKPAPGPECMQERRDAVLAVLARKPEYPPGEKFAYSNIGYTHNRWCDG